MHLTVGGLVLGAFLGVIGAAYFLYGRRQARIPHLVCGLVLMVLPWVLSGVAVLLGVGLTVAAAPLLRARWFDL